MAKTKSKKKPSRKPPPTTTSTGLSSSSSSTSEPQQQPESVLKKPKIPFEVNEAYELREHTLDELIALTRATDQWTASVHELCASKMNICLYGSRKEQQSKQTQINSKPLHRIRNISIDFVFDEPKMREEKMIQLAQEVIRLFPNLYGFLVFYHPPLNHFFPLLIEQIITTSELNVHMLSIGKAPLEPKWKTKWWTTLSSVPDLRRVFLREPGQLPPIIYENANRLVHVRAARITEFDWDLVPLFKQFGPKLEALELEVNTRFNCDLDELDRLLEKNPRIGANLHKLHLNSRLRLLNSAEEQSKLFRIVVKHFPKLQVLNIRVLMKLNFEEILNEIAKLPKLEELCMVALWHGEFIPESIDNLVPNTTVTRLRIFNPIDVYIDLFSRIIVPLFPNLKWIGVATTWRDNVDQFKAKLPVLYPDAQRTKTQVKWYDLVGSNKEQVFEQEESPMDVPDRWTGWMDVLPKQLTNNPLLNQLPSSP